MSGQPSEISWLMGAPEEPDALYEIYDRAFPSDASEKWSRNGFADILALEGILLGVAEVDNRPAALAIVRTVLDEAELLTICVDPAHQGRGLASNILGAATAHLASGHIRRIFLEVRQSNEAALALYRAAGFVEDGRRRDYYSSHHGVREDALLLSLAVSVAV